MAPSNKGSGKIGKSGKGGRGGRGGRGRAGVQAKGSKEETNNVSKNCQHYRKCFTE